VASTHARTRLLQVPYFSAVNLDEMEALLRTRLGFTDDDISQAYANAKAASFAKDAARLAGATPAGAAGQVHASLVVLGGVFLLVLTLLSAGALRAYRKQKRPHAA
jgi:hypothetical protein